MSFRQSKTLQRVLKERKDSVTKLMAEKRTCLSQQELKKVGELLKLHILAVRHYQTGEVCSDDTKT